MIKIIDPDNIISKKWGMEVILHNDEKYCGKILSFKADTRFSMHYHILKTETWYISECTFILRYIDTNTADVYEKNLYSGMIVEIEPGSPHQLIAVTDGVIFEASTQHFDNDSYRVGKGDSQL